MAIKNNLTGKRFGKLTVIKYSHSKENHRSYWECICDCGKTCIINGGSLNRGSTNSCGCLRKEMAKEWGKTRLRKHGLHAHPLMRIWDAMMQRCTNPKASGYKNYGGRGVIVCEEWAKSFKAFYDWAIQNGWEPGLQLDKDIKGENLLYSPNTCCFANRVENNRNKRTNVFITYKGETKCLIEWANGLGISSSALHARLFKNNWPLEEALTTRKTTKNERYKSRHQ